MANQPNPYLQPPGTPAPDVNPQAAGTQFGNALQSARKQVVNTQVGQLNTLTRAGAGVVNAATAIPRAIGGFARDTAMAVAGLNPSQNAGQPIGGITAPQLQAPYPAPTVNFRTGAQPGPGAPATDPATAAAPVATTPNNGAPADNISAGNLATANRFTGAAAAGMPDMSSAASPTTNQQLKQPGIDSGVNINGRHLDYGANVGGVPTFSDGTAGIPQTMGKAGMAELAQQRSISRADPGAAGNVLASDALGYTPSTAQQVATLVRNAPQQITGSRPSAQQFADAQRNDIASGDWRSAAGTAAHNLRMDMQYGGAGEQKAAALGLADLTAGSNQGGQLAQQAENQAALTDQQGANTLANTALQGRDALANTALQGRDALAATQAKLQMPRAGHQVTLADGTLGIQDSITGAVTRGTLPDGSVARGMPKNTAPIYTSAGGQAALQALTNNILGVNPLTGKIDSPDGKSSRFATNAKLYAAMQKAQQQLKSLDSSQQGASQAKAPPAAGTVVGNFRFKGGDPSIQSNWEAK